MFVIGTKKFLTICRYEIHTPICLNNALYALTKICCVQDDITRIMASKKKEHNAKCLNSNTQSHV